MKMREQSDATKLRIILHMQNRVPSQMSLSLQDARLNGGQYAAEEN